VNAPGNHHAARRRPRRQPVWQRPLVRVAALAATLLLTLLLGISVGRALEDGPAPGGTKTNIRTLEPRPLPAVTVTVTG
jgi:hypothetical protein